MSQDITAIDLFCGAGGSSTGLVSAGVRVMTAVNHWKLAIETHSTNHPNTDHDLTDIRLTHPKRYPKTDIFWASPECTNHSLAKGRKRKNIDQLDLWGNTQVDPEEERSRATMREVVEFAQYHQYNIIIVENVIDIRYWAHYDHWLQDMINLGYEQKALYLNAQFFGVPQSRDRIYVVFWRKGNKAPDLDFRPPAICEKHGQVEAIQSWKKPEYQWGRFGSRRQYVYRCPQCAGEVMPFYVPAMCAIDWSLPSQRIGDRKHPLKPKTVERIKTGLKKFAGKAVVVDLGYAGGDRVTDTNDPLPTQTTRQTLGLTTPPFMVLISGSARPLLLDETFHTIVAAGSQHALITPFVTSTNYFDDITRSVTDPLPTQTTAKKLALTLPPFLMQYYGREDASSSIDDPIPVIPTERRHAIILPPFLLNYLNNQTPPRGTEEPLLTIASRNNPALVTPPFIMAMYSNAVYADVLQTPMPTECQINKHYVIVPGEELPTPDQMLPDCGFRMLKSHELQRGQSFPDSYIILGTERQKVKQIGDAVAVNVATWIVQRCVDSLS